ncbi:hypothetical protein ACLKA7_001002 [Drosophila subpalustris]
MAPPQKRQRENTAADIKLRTLDASSPQLLELINKRFGEQAELIRLTEQRILGELQERINSMSLEMQQLIGRVQQLEEEAAEVKSLKVKLMSMEANWESKLQVQANEAIAADLRIHGAPCIEGENLNALFTTLCGTLGSDPAPKLRDIFRVRQRSANSTEDPIIIAKLEHVREKIALLKLIADYRRTKKQQLSLTQLGFESHVPFYVNEQLTKAYYDIFKEAMKMKKLNMLTAVYTRRSLVHMRVSGSEGYICIGSMPELLSLRADNALSQPEQSFRNG